MFFTLVHNVRKFFTILANPWPNSCKRWKWSHSLQQWLWITVMKQVWISVLAICCNCQWRKSFRVNHDDCFSVIVKWQPNTTHYVRSERYQHSIIHASFLWAFFWIKKMVSVEIWDFLQKFFKPVCIEFSSKRTFVRTNNFVVSRWYLLLYIGHMVPMNR